MERTEGLKLHSGGAGNGGKPPQADMETILRSVEQWLASNDFCEVTIKRRRGNVTLERKITDNFEVQK